MREKIKPKICNIAIYTQIRTAKSYLKQKIYTNTVKKKMFKFEYLKNYLNILEILS